MVFAQILNKFLLNNIPFLSLLLQLYSNNLVANAEEITKLAYFFSDDQYLQVFLFIDHSWDACGFSYFFLGQRT